MCRPVQGRGGLFAASVKRSKFLGDRRGCGKMDGAEAQAVAVRPNGREAKCQVSCSFQHPQSDGPPNQVFELYFS